MLHNSTPMTSPALFPPKIRLILGEEHFDLHRKYRGTGVPNILSTVKGREGRPASSTFGSMD
jgi:hypothetical protein